MATKAITKARNIDLLKDEGIAEERLQYLRRKIEADSAPDQFLILDEEDDSDNEEELEEMKNRRAGSRRRFLTAWKLNGLVQKRHLHKH